jgi:hypothetical protein
MAFSAKAAKRGRSLYVGASGYAPEVKDADISPEERRKKIAEWLITWLKEGDARLAMH